MKKRRNKKGFTLIEMLIATAILAIFVSMAIVGTTELFGTGEQLAAVSKAAVLGSDVMKTVTNEIRFGEEFSLDGTTVTYNSTSYGNGCRIEVENGQLAIVQTSKIFDATGKEVSGTKTFYPIGTVAYDEVHIKSIGFTIDEQRDSDGNLIRQAISCTLSITSDGEKVLWEKTATLVPLYLKISS